MSTPLPEGINLDDLEPGYYRCYAEDARPLDPPTHTLQSVGPAPVTAWVQTDAKTGESYLLHRD